MTALLPPVAALSHGLAAAAFLILALLLGVSWRRRRHALPLAAVCALSACWAAVTALAAASDDGTGMLWGAADALEAVRSAAWIAVLIRLLGAAGAVHTRSLAALAAMVALQAVLLAWTGAPPMPAVDVADAVDTVADVAHTTVPASMLAAGETPADADADAGSMPALALIVCRLLLAIAGMLLLEQLYRGTPPHERWHVKFACLAIGGVLAYDFYLYSDALLLRHVNPDIWAARGLVNALTAPLLGVAAARNPGWTPGLSLSRHLLFRSAALIGCALYLLAMAFSAWYLRSLGGRWGPLMQFACLFGAALVLGGVLLSGAARARVRVLISKHLYQSRFDYREEWRRFTQALSGDGPDLGQRAVQALAALVESPAGALWIRRDGGALLAAANWNMPPQPAQERPSAPFFDLMESRQWVVDVPAWLTQPQRDGDVPPWLRDLPQLWLLVPLLLHGRLFGVIALARPRAPVQLDWEIRDLLKIAGSQAAGYLAHRELAQRLAVTHQFDSFNRMAAFIVHDLKNLVSQLSLLLSNAEQHRHNPAFQQDMLDTVAHSVGKMTLLLQRLSRNGSHRQQAQGNLASYGQAAMPYDASADGDGAALRPLPLAALLEQAVRACSAYVPQPRLELDDVAPAWLAGAAVLADWSRLERVLGHLIQNAVEATPADGHIVLRLGAEQEGAAIVDVRDTGAGMSETFIRDRLFQPFDSTKPAGMGIGVYESREYIRELGGRLDVTSTPGGGTTFRITLPLLVPAPVRAAAGQRA